MGADAAPTPRQWQGHSHRALRAMPMQLRKEKQALRLKMVAVFSFSIAFFLRLKAQFGMQHPMLPGAWGEQPHKSNPPHESILTPLSKNHLHRFYAREGIVWD